MEVLIKCTELESRDLPQRNAGARCNLCNLCGGETTKCTLSSISLWGRDVRQGNDSFRRITKNGEDSERCIIWNGCKAYFKLNVTFKSSFHLEIRLNIHTNLGYIRRDHRLKIGPTFDALSRSFPHLVL